MSNSGRLNGKVAIITGAANGIGKASAIIFAREGARLVLADVNEDALKETAGQVTGSGGLAVYKKTDVSVEQEVKALIDFALATYSQVDVLVNNAGISGFLFGPEEQNSDEWHKIFDVNVMGPVYATKYVAAHMKERRSGSIVNIASVAGVRSGAGGNAYSASKAALINFSQTTACDFGGNNVRVNAVCPGLIETAMTRPFFEYARNTGKEKQLGKYCELRRPAQPVEVANMILFLASDEASYVTGQAIPVDGGITASLSIPGRKI